MIRSHLVGEVDQIHPFEDNCRREQIWHLMIFFSKKFFLGIIFFSVPTFAARKVKELQAKLYMPTDVKSTSSSENECKFLLLLEIGEIITRTSLDVDDMFLVVVFFISKNYLPPKADKVVFLRQAPLTKCFTFFVIS